MKSLRIKWGLYLLYGLVALLILSPFSMTNASVPSTIKLGLNPTSQLFKAENLSPGDEVVAELIIINNGEVNFDYKVSAEQEKGDQQFYEELSLEISKADSLIFDGKLSTLASLELGQLNSFAEENLIFKVTLPITVGNEIQGKSATVNFIFVATGKKGEDAGGPDDPSDPDDPKDPNYPGKPSDPSDPGDSDDPNKPSDPPSGEPSDQDTSEEIPIDSDPNKEDADQKSGSDAYEDYTDQDDADQEAFGSDSGDSSSSGDKSAVKEGLQLPKTATPWYNILLISTILFIGSSTLLYVMSRKAKKLNV